MRRTGRPSLIRRHCCCRCSSLSARLLGLPQLVPLQALKHTCACPQPVLWQRCMRVHWPAVARTLLLWGSGCLLPVMLVSWPTLLVASLCRGPCSLKEAARDRRLCGRLWALRSGWAAAVLPPCRRAGKRSLIGRRAGAADSSLAVRCRAAAECGLLWQPQR